MNNQDINAALQELARASYELETAYIDNGGEVTDVTEDMEAQVEALKGLLNTEGVDSLGRWLKSKEDEVKALKAEKDYVSRKIAAAGNTIEYIKAQINHIMTATGVAMIKSRLGYSFAPTTSVKTSVDKEVLNGAYLEAVEKKLRGGKKPVIPADVTVTLGASVKALPEDAALPAYYCRTETPSCRFGKPRANKEQREEA